MFGRTIKKQIATTDLGPLSKGLTTINSNKGAKAEEDKTIRQMLADIDSVLATVQDNVDDIVRNSLVFSKLNSWERHSKQTNSIFYTLIVPI